MFDNDMVETWDYKQSNYLFGKCTFLRLWKLKICTTYPSHYTSVPDLCEAHIANQWYSPFTMADDPFSSGLPPSLPPTIPPLNNNINKVPVQGKISKFGQELTDVAPKLDMDNTPAASGSLPSLCYHFILPPPTAAHSHSHASNAVPIPERTNFLKRKISIPPVDTTALILKTWCSAIHLTAILLEETTLTSYQSPLLPHQQNQPNRTFHLAMPSPLRLYTSQP